jgi:hypothetical protein
MNLTHRTILAAILGLAIISCMACSNYTPPTSTKTTAGATSRMSATPPSKDAFPSVEREMEEMARDLNKGLPRQTDSVTRWDRVETGPGKTCSYIYTWSFVPTESQKDEIQKKLVAQIRALPQMQPFLAAGGTVWFKYYDAKGKSILEVPVTKQ